MDNIKITTDRLESDADSIRTCVARMRESLAVIESAGEIDTDELKTVLDHMDDLAEKDKAAKEKYEGLAKEIDEMIGELSV